MKNQVDAMRSFSAAEGVAHFLNSSLTKTEILKVKEDILEGNSEIQWASSTAKKEMGIF